MSYLDSALLNVTEWACRRFQLLTGRTNVWLALQFTNLSIVVYFVWAGVHFWISDLGTRIGLGLFCGGLFYLLTQTVFKTPIEAYEASAYRRVAKGFRNPRRIRDALLRISFLTLSVVLFYPVLFVYLNLRLSVFPLSYSLIVLTTVVLYLLACDPLPPCVGKLREWLRRSAASRMPASEPEAQRPAICDNAQWKDEESASQPTLVDRGANVPVRQLRLRPLQLTKARHGLGATAARQPSDRQSWPGLRSASAGTSAIDRSRLL